jgi:hypothetical protein
VDDETKVSAVVIGVDTPLSDFVIATASSAADIKPIIDVKSELRPLATSGDSKSDGTDSQYNSAVRAKDFAAVLRHKIEQLVVPADKLVSVEARSLLLSVVKEHLAPVAGVGLETLVSQFLAANPCDNTNELLMLVKESDTRLDSLAGALILEAGLEGLNAGLGGFNAKAMALADPRKVFLSRSLKKVPRCIVCL